MEKDTRLEELADRYPETAADVAKVKIEEPSNMQSPPPEDGGWTIKKISRDVMIGVIVAVLMIFFGPYVAAFVP